MNKILYLFSVILIGLSLIAVISCCEDDNNGKSPKWDIGEIPGTVFATFNDGTLTISGSGKIKDFGYTVLEGTRPWYDVYEDITGFVVEGGEISFPTAFMRFHPNLMTVSMERSGVTQLGLQLFADCVNLTSVTLPNSLKSIGWSTFANCKKLTSITIPEGVTSIGNNTFQDCESLPSITIPNSVTRIDPRAFVRCTGLSSVIIGSGVTLIDREAFQDCTNLTDIVFQGSDSLKTIGLWAFERCSSLASLTIPKVEYIANYAFWDCSSLTAISIGSIVAIGQRVFLACSSLTSVELPASVTDIGYWAFQDCINLSSFTVHWETPLSVTHLVFENVNTSAVTLYVPAGTKESYQSTPIWRDFNIVEKNN